MNRNRRRPRQRQPGVIEIADLKVGTKFRVKESGVTVMIIGKAGAGRNRMVEIEPPIHVGFHKIPMHFLNMRRFIEKIEPLCEQDPS